MKSLHQSNVKRLVAGTSSFPLPSSAWARPKAMSLHSNVRKCKNSPSLSVNWLLESYAPRDFETDFFHWQRARLLYLILRSFIRKQEAMLLCWSSFSVHSKILAGRAGKLPPFSSTSVLLICLTNVPKNCQMTVSYWLIHHAVKLSIPPAKPSATPNVKHERLAV